MSATRALIRFDGVSFAVFDSTNVPEFRSGASGMFYPLFTDRSGAMWVKGPNGLFLSYRDGQFHIMTPAGSGITWLEQDGQGRVWADAGRIRLLVNGKLVPPPLPPGVPDTGTTGIVRDTGGGIWIGTNTNGLWHAVGTMAEHFGQGRITPIIQSTDGILWANTDRPRYGLQRLSGGAWSPVLDPLDSTKIITRGATQGPDGSVWIATNGFGLIRWKNGIIERFRSLPMVRMSVLAARTLADFVSGAVIQDRYAHPRPTRRR